MNGDNDDDDGDLNDDRDLDTDERIRPEDEEQHSHQHDFHRLVGPGGDAPSYVVTDTRNPFFEDTPKKYSFPEYFPDVCVQYSQRTKKNATSHDTWTCPFC